MRTEPQKDLVHLVFWKLPYKLRFLIYRISKPKLFHHNQNLRRIKEPTSSSSLSGFDKFKCIYVHIPKTGGVSVNQSLFKNLGGGHKGIKDYSLIYAQKEFNEYYKFTIVRNPYERLVSGYYFLKNGGLNSIDSGWYNDNLAKYSSFEEFVLQWVNLKNIYKQIHFIPQYEFLKIHNKLALDNIYKFENLDYAFQDITKRLKITDTVLQKRNITKKRKDNYYKYTENMKNVVYNTYKQDFILLDYPK